MAQPPIETDALVIGAGPAGLFQVFQLGLQDIQAQVVEALPYAGGQCATLYKDKPIYDIPAIKVCTGQDLTEQLLHQITPFRPTFHFNELVTELNRRSDGRFDITAQTAAGLQTTFIAKTVLIAAGVGAFLPRTLNLEGLAAFEGRQLWHQIDDAQNLAGQRVVIAGDNDIALEWALRLSPSHANGFEHKARSVTVIHRRDQFTAAAELVGMFRTQVASGGIQFVAGQPSAIVANDDLLTGLQVNLPDGSMPTVQLDRLLVLQGLSPKLGPIAHWGIEMERKQIQVDTASYATNEPGIFAVGDINTYPGKKKLILCAFHECVLAAFAAAALIHPDKKPMLEYTTTSTRLHKALGVS